MVVAAELAALSNILDPVLTTHTREVQREGVKVVLEVVALRYVPGVAIGFCAYAHVGLLDSYGRLRMALEIINNPRKLKNPANRMVQISPTMGSPFA
jgi:hypothetical protein